MIKYMVIIKDTMKNLYLSGEFKEAEKDKKRNFIEEYGNEFKKINLTKDDEKRYDDIVFTSTVILIYLFI